MARLTWPYFKLLQRVATRYHCFEFAAFDVREEEHASRQRAHIRGGEAVDEEIRLSAVQAFRRIVDSCVAKRKDGAIRIDGTASEGTWQYCIVMLAKRKAAIVGAAAFIVRCTDLKVARAMLKLMKDDARDFVEQ